MANLDRNFIATPSFVVKSEGAGNTITMQATPITSSTNTVGWSKINFGFSGLIAALNADLSPYNVTPSVGNLDDNYVYTPVNPDVPADEGNIRQMRVYNFLNFVHDNPVHVKAVNLRAANEQVLPQQIIVKTPNIFTGQLDRQIIDVASKKTAYQYQNGIITITDCDFYLCRNSIIEFTGAFSVATASAGAFFIDLVIDLYLSLEKGLVENNILLNTASGVYTAAKEQAENQAAASNPTLVVNYDGTAPKTYQSDIERFIQTKMQR